MRDKCHRPLTSVTFGKADILRRDEDREHFGVE